MTYKILASIIITITVSMFFLATKDIVLALNLCIYVSSIITITYQRVNILSNIYVRELQLRKMKSLGQGHIFEREQN